MRWVAIVVLIIFRVVPMLRPVCRNTKTPRPYFTVKRSPKCNYGFTFLRHSLLARNPFHFLPFLAVLRRLEQDAPHHILARANVFGAQSALEAWAAFWATSAATSDQHNFVSEFHDLLIHTFILVAMVCMQTSKD